MDKSSDPKPLLDAFNSDTPLGEFLRYFSERLRDEEGDTKRGISRGSEEPKRA